jgi:hypothetical protein
MEVDFVPYKKTSFNSYLKYESSQGFVEVLANANPPDFPFQAKFYWANGVLFRVFSHAPTEANAKEMMSGHLILDHIEFTSMPQYVSLLDIPGRPLGRVNVINVTNHTIFDPLSAWIRDNLL